MRSILARGVSSVTPFIDQRKNMKTSSFNIAVTAEVARRLFDRLEDDSPSRFDINAFRSQNIFGLNLSILV